MKKRKGGVVGLRMRFDNWIKTYHDLLNKSDALNGVGCTNERLKRNMYLALLKMSENKDYELEYRINEIRRWVRRFDKKTKLTTYPCIIEYLNKKSHDL